MIVVAKSYPLLQADGARSVIWSGKAKPPERGKAAKLAASIVAKEISIARAPGTHADISLSS